MSDGRPSIAELEALDAKSDLTTDELLEIASALTPLLGSAKAALSLATLEATDDVGQVAARRFVVEASHKVRR